MTSQNIAIIGCGPGSPDYLTPAARQAVERAEVLVGAQRLLDLFPASRAERIAVGANVGKALDEISARRGRRIGVLVTGDPGLCSLALPVLRRFGRDACEVIAGVSSVQVAFARLGLDWLDARILSAHERDPEVDAASLAQAGKIAVLAGRPESLRWIAGLAKSLGDDRQVFVCENLTLEDERVREATPSELAALQASSRTVVLLVKRGPLA